jgi:hypothetical protein
VIKHPLGHGSALAVILVAGVLAVVGPAVAREPAGDLATVTVSSTGVDFRPEVEYNRAILTVSGGGQVFRYEFSPGEEPFLDIFRPTGEPLADGVYNWELDLLPASEARATLMIAATKNDGEASDAREAQTGAFAVVDGYIADPELEEASGRRYADSAGFGNPGSEALTLGNRSPSDLSSETDSDSGMCDRIAASRSGSCEADVMDALASLGDPAADPFTSGLGKRAGNGDSDSEVAAGGAGEIRSQTSVETSEATPPRKTYDPEGANGRPRSEEDQR